MFMYFDLYNLWYYESLMRKRNLLFHRKHIHYLYCVSL